MSISNKGKIFFVQPFAEEDVVFYKVERSTTNTCEIFQMEKKIVFQNEDFQFVEPGTKKTGQKQRCKVIKPDVIQLKTGDMAQVWDGKPVKQSTIIFLPVF